MVDKDTLDRISDEIAHLDIELNKVYSPEKGEYLYGCVDYDKALPKVKDILNKYDLVTLDFEAMPSQVIETANCTFIFGRTDGILKYNSNEFDADSFVIKRENGEGNLVARYNYGFILGADEKVSVIINGKTYK
ncbi:MAG: hypothetical protein J5372_11075 [Lachnospiraceae bacterium]|nr:hypothetical protein [Lachnospiraceae bacterium]